MFSEIVDNCPTLEGVHFMIAPSMTVHTIVEGYEIHMSGQKIDDKTIAYLRDLAGQKGLFIDSRSTAVAIYKTNGDFWNEARRSTRVIQRDHRSMPKSS